MILFFLFYRIKKIEIRVLVEKKVESVIEIRKIDIKIERIVIEIRKIKKIVIGIKRVVIRIKMMIRKIVIKIGKNVIERKRKGERYEFLCNYKGFKLFKWNVYYVGDLEVIRGYRYIGLYYGKLIFL